MRVLIALGGNALTSADGGSSPADQIAAVTVAAGHIATVAADGHQVVLTHGNGPQVGNLLLMNELAATEVAPMPLDWCDAQTQATIGFIIANALERALAARALPLHVCAVVSRTVVDADDPGFTAPSKPIGRYLPADEAAVLVEHGEIWQDRGERGWRRVVASPQPRRMIDFHAVKTLVDNGFVVIAAGGGGIPCVREADGSVRGVPAVIDKDLTAALFGGQIEADVLVIATDVAAAILHFGTPQATPIGSVTVSRLRGYAAEGHFADGSMGPKVEAACRFVEGGGRRAVIGTLEQIEAAVRGETGTVVVPDSEGPSSRP
jgi:carbamate kinase